ncbi:hypothetical protein H310_12150 [Aphanomyces invadans]|uniref:LRAT domain-containing protein n=1 Tax=Aphanomyces invadans TaxID=157072 RepID=A0A024TJ10_9STRA|nr:hypothetical protein H310_12150 [Aphanomyces invadans]ETV94150.1 hypothetical protein H310_12150 [Aphanomyces invadans]|eukprot:XP_008877353.1 hypothetical protein H310_12150 [Aphanomyces invadans]
MNTAVYDVSTLQPGDQVCIWDFGRWPISYSHHGIVYERGTSMATVMVAHTWSPLSNFAEAQADSYFRLTTLEAFLNGRQFKHLRRVQYSSSILGDAISKLGEVHRSASDIPPVVLARCKFLLGAGRGHFNILSLNCEHVAYWCKTGRLFAKQIFTTSPTTVPYIRQRSLSCKLDALNSQVHELKESYRLQCKALCRRLNHVDDAGHRKRVYIKAKDSSNRFLQARGEILYLVECDFDETNPLLQQFPTPFFAFADHTDVNVVKVSFQEVATGRMVCSKAKCVKLINQRMYHRENLFRFEYAFNGELQSRRLRRWYIGARPKDGLVRTFVSSDFAMAFEFVDADSLKCSRPTDVGMAPHHEPHDTTPGPSDDELDLSHPDAAADDIEIKRQ